MHDLFDFKQSYPNNQKFSELIKERKSAGIYRQTSLILEKDNQGIFYAKDIKIFTTQFSNYYSFLTSNLSDNNWSEYTNQITAMLETISTIEEVKLTTQIIHEYSEAIKEMERLINSGSHLTINKISSYYQTISNFLDNPKVESRNQLDRIYVENNFKVFMDFIIKDNSDIVVKLAVSYFYYQYLNPFFDCNYTVATLIFYYLLRKAKILITDCFNIITLVGESYDLITKELSNLFAQNDSFKQIDATPFIVYFYEQIFSSALEINGDYYRLINFTLKQLKKGNLTVSDSDIVDFVFLNFRTQKFSTKDIERKSLYAYETIRKAFEKMSRLNIIKPCGNNKYRLETNKFDDNKQKLLPLIE